jgi:hypothetical protein
MKTTKAVVEKLKATAKVIQKDIDEGDCRCPENCMHKLAIARSLQSIDPSGGDHKIKVDAGIIIATIKGWKWRGILPLVAKRSLRQFDLEDKEREKAKKLGVKFKSAIKSHSYRFVLEKWKPVVKLGPRTEARLAQIRAARKARGETTGEKDHIRYSRWSRRVDGLGNI